MSLSTSEEAKGQIEEEHDYFVSWWKKSLFFWLPLEKDEFWTTTGIEEPTSRFYMDDGRLLCAWLQPNLTHNHFRSRTEPEDDEEDSIFLNPFGDLSKMTEDLKNTIRQEGGVLVEPEKARHIIGYIANDPYPKKDEIEYRSIDVELNTGEIPTPIIPSSRNIQFNLVWHLKEVKIECSKEIDQISERINFRLIHNKLPFKISLDYDDDNLSKKTYLMANLDYIPIVGEESTTILLENIDPALKNTINEIEEEFKRFFLFERATNVYWMMEIGVLF